MNDEAFLETIRQNPEDDAPRLVYADWLEEQSDLRAEFLRLEVQWAHGKRSQMHAPISKRMEKLRASIDLNWLAWVERANRYSVYWPASICEVFAERGEIGKPLRFLVGGPNFFVGAYSLIALLKRRRIEPGDYVYPITVRQRRLHVIARMRVREVTTAAAFFTARPEEAWVSIEPTDGELLIGEGGTIQRLDRVLPPGAVSRLQFQLRDRQRGLKHVQDGELRHSVDLQGILRLTQRSAMDFERLLAGMPFPDLPADGSSLFE